MKEFVFGLNEDTNRLNVTFETNRLYLESVSSDYLPNYTDLFGKKENIEKYATGEIWDSKKTESRVNNWVARWEDNIPFSAFAVFKKTPTPMEFIGNVVMGYGDVPGTSEFAAVFDKKYWQQGFGSEAIVPVITEYPLEVIKRGYKIEGNDFISIVATSRKDNEASIKILKKAGMKITGEEKKFGHNRYNFFVTVEELKSRHQQPPVNEMTEGEKNSETTESPKTINKPNF